MMTNPNIAHNDKKSILITGSTNTENLNLILSDFDVKNISNIAEKKYVIEDCTLFIEIDLDRTHFDISTFENKINTFPNLKAIICLENLNPRPETLVNNIKILGDAFEQKLLKTNLYFCFTSNNKLDINYVRESALQFNEVFRVIGIQHDKKLKDQFVKDKIYTLDIITELRQKIKNLDEKIASKRAMCNII